MESESVYKLFIENLEHLLFSRLELKELKFDNREAEVFREGFSELLKQCDLAAEELEQKINTIPNYTLLIERVQNKMIQLQTRIDDIKSVNGWTNWDTSVKEASEDREKHNLLFGFHKIETVCMRFAKKFSELSPKNSPKNTGLTDSDTNKPITNKAGSADKRTRSTEDFMALLPPNIPDASKKLIDQFTFTDKKEVAALIVAVGLGKNPSTSLYRSVQSKFRTGYTSDKGFTKAVRKFQNALESSVNGDPNKAKVTEIKKRLKIQ